MIDIKSIILDTPTEKLENLLSPFIQEQFPEFIRSDYPKLTLFIKSYYEWLETQNNPGYVLSKLDSVGDVDKNLEEFYSHFKNTYLESFPDMFATNINGNKPNKKTLLKKIKEFYGNKGTESAYSFLFRVLYDSDLEIYYPKADILKVSDGNWIEPRSIKTTTSNGTALFDVKNGEITQYKDTTLVASAFIEDVVQYVFNGVLITEFFIRDIVGNFESDKTVVVRKDSNQYYEKPYSVLGEFFIELPGNGYQIGDLVTVQDSDGIGFSARIEQTGLAGTIKKIAILNSGINYPTSIVANIISERGQRTAKVILISSTITNYPGYFSGNQGKVSSTKYIQDGNYYQDFSYVLKSQVSFDQYFDVLKTIIHPSGTRMFGSVLVKKELQNLSSSSSQGTFIENPLVGQYTPYRFETTTNLRKNGNSNSGYWLGVTGDLYPFGYNPYIGNTLQVGPNGKTTANGTVFVYSQLGYTWCYVPENGVTSHNPIGAALGSTSAWYLNTESTLDPSSIDGLVLWLKPENIGVCGSVVNGASADVWLDASPQANHALPPTWDRWNGVLTTTYTGLANGGWSKQVYTTDPITKLRFVFNGLCGGFTTGRLVMVGLNTDPNTDENWSSIDYAIYSVGSYSTTTYNRKFYVYENGYGSYETLLSTGTNFSGLDNAVCEVEYVEPNVIYRVDGVVKRTVYAGYGKTYYMDSSFYGDGTNVNNGHSLTVLGMWNGTNPVTPTTSTTNTSSGLTTVIYAGVTVDKLRPTLQTAGFGGATGVSFNGGLVFAPASTYRGVTLGGVVGLGYTTGSGSSAAAVLTGQHMYLRKPLTITDDADIFVVYRSTRDGLSYGYGLLGSRNTNCDFSANPSVRFDSVLFSRSYNEQDRTAAQQNSSYYTVLPNGTLMYPGASLPPVGVFGFRPCGDQTGVLQNSIVYDPHVSGACLGICVGEAVRDSSNKIEVFLNGDRGLNKSRSTGRRVSSVTSPSNEDWVTTKNLVYGFDAGKTACISSVVSGFSSDLLRGNQFTPTPYNVLKSGFDPNNFRSDSSAQGVGFSRVTQVLNEPVLGTDEVYKAVISSSGNLYTHSTYGTNSWRNASLTSTSWTFSMWVRRANGSAIPSNIGVYIDGLGSNNAAPATTVEDMGGGWYRVRRNKTGTAPTNVTLVGITGLTPGETVYFARLQLLPYNTGDINGVLPRIDTSYPSSVGGRYGTIQANSVEREYNPWGHYDHVWRGENHSTINTVHSFNPNGGFYTRNVPIDRTKLYRYSVWINRKVLGNGQVYFGNNDGTVLNRSNGQTNTNPYFTVGSESSAAFTGNQNKWVLAVGHIYPVGSGSGNNHPNSGMYLVNTGTTYAGLDTGSQYGDKIWSSTSTSDALRVFLYGSNQPGTEALFYRPRIDLVDGNEPDIQDLVTNVPQTVYDIGPNGSTGRVYGNPQYSAESGGHLLFDGKSTFVESGDNVLYGYYNKTYTFEAWVKPSDISNETKMFSGIGGLPYFATQGNAYFWSFNLSGVQKSYSYTVPYPIDTRWAQFVYTATHIPATAASTEKTRFQVYINGVLVWEQTLEGTEVLDPTYNTLGIGNRFFNASTNGQYTANGSDYSWIGGISNVRVYNRALSPEEITQNFNSLRGRFGL